MTSQTISVTFASYRSVCSFLAGVFAAAAVHLHVHAVDDVEEVVHDRHAPVLLHVLHPASLTLKRKQK